MNFIIPIINVRTIFGHKHERFWDRDLPNFSDMGRTRTDFLTVTTSANPACVPGRLREVVDSPERLMELLKLHLVGNKVTTESVRKSASGQVSPAGSAGGRPGKR